MGITFEIKCDGRPPTSAEAPVRSTLWASAVWLNIASYMASCVFFTASRCNSQSHGSFRRWRRSRSCRKVSGPTRCGLASSPPRKEIVLKRMHEGVVFEMAQFVSLTSMWSRTPPSLVLVTLLLRVALLHRGVELLVGSPLLLPTPN